jgi:hypothetical protein
MMRLRMFSIGYKPVPYRLPRGGWIEPFAVGPLAQVESDGLRDDGRGDSLAELNPSFGELTAHYWVWRHMRDVDAVGFCHYRRYFNFLPAVESPHLKLFAEPSDAMMGFLAQPAQREAALKLLSQSDVVASRTCLLPHSIAQQFRVSHGTNLWEAFVRALESTAPAWLRAYLPWLEFSQEARFYPVFILRWDEFDRFCGLLFPLLMRLRGEIGDLPDIPGQRFQPNRYPAYLAERFMMLYFHARGLRVHGAQLIALESDA